MHKELAHFLASMNQQKQHHIGYCGDNEAEILQTLEKDFSPLEDVFFVSKDMEINGAIGLDIDNEEKTAEVWGPFSTSEEVALQLWKKLKETYESTLNTLYFFINKENQQGIRFAQNIGAHHQGNHFILEASKNHYEQKAIDFKPQYTDSFSELHEAAFPNTYHSAKEIISKLDDLNRLLILTDQHNIKGYVYIEALPEYGEGNIEFITVSPQYRRQGIGTQLTQSALASLFQFEEIASVTLCVSATNDSALSLYQAAGFSLKHELMLFTYQF